MTSEPTPPLSDTIHVMRAEFRLHLETFYARLKLAPPYESVEKAVRALTTSLHALPKDEQRHVAADFAGKWRHFRQAFETSGLSKKHRGIISWFARNRRSLDLLPSTISSWPVRY